MPARSPAGTLERSLKAISIAAATAQARRAITSQSEQGGDLFQQAQIALTGTAALAAVSADQTIKWRLPFLYAPQQREAPFKNPHFSYGIEFTTPPADIVIVQVAVIGWTKDARNWIVGATLRHMVYAPNAKAADTVSFEAVAHLTFQGWGAQPGDTNV